MQRLTYADLAYADQYFQDILGAELWHETYEEVKIKALVTATKQIDCNSFIGQKLYRDQPLAFPRNFSKRRLSDVELIMYKSESESLDNIPEAIKKATCEQALHLIEGLNHKSEFDQLRAKGVKSYQVGDASITFNTQNVPYALSQIHPKALAYLNPYLKRYSRLI